MTQEKPKVSEEKNSLLNDIAVAGGETVVESARDLALGIMRAAVALGPIIGFVTLWMEGKGLPLAILPNAMALLFGLVFLWKRDIADAIGAVVGWIGGTAIMLLTTLDLVGPSIPVFFLSTFLAAGIPNWRTVKLLME